VGIWRRGSARVINQMDEIFELSASESIMAAGHEESDMSEAMNDQRIKIYTADG
jgi:hypothetical protein